MSLKHVLAALVGCICLIGGALAEENSVVDKTTSALGRAADATARGISRGVKATGHGIEVGLNATAYGIKRGAEATSGALKKVGNKIAGSSGTDTHSGVAAENGEGQKSKP